MDPTSTIVASASVDIKAFLEREMARLLNFLRLQPTAVLAEVRIAYHLTPQVENFVLGAEAATFDAGVIIQGDPNFVWSPDPTERLIDVLDTFKGRQVLLPLEVKTIVPHANAWWEGSLYRYSVGVSEHQRGSGLVLVMNPEFPELVAAVLPTMIARNIRMVPYHEPDVEPFPMELIPFVMPITFLAQAVRELIKFYHDPQRGYRNPYNGVIFTKCPAPTLYPVENLLPTETNRLNDWPDFVRVWRAFDQYSTAFRVERFMACRVTGDFQIAHIQSGVRVAVEMKRGGMFGVSQPGTLTHAFEDQQGTSRLFTPLTCWDFLLSAGNKTALFVSRDSLPLGWFNAPNPVGSGVHSWQAGRDFLRKHIVEWNQPSMAGFVRGVEAVLEAQLAQTGKLYATRPIPFTIPSAIEMKRYWHWVDAEKMAQPIAKNWHPDRGTKRYRSRQKYHARYERLIKRECLRSSFGALSRNGYHPSAWYNLAMGAFDGARPIRFAELDMDTLFVFINFAQLDDLDLPQPTDARRPSPFFHVSHGESPSIFIMTLHPLELEGRGLNWCVVSSLQLQGDEDRAQWNEAVLSEGWLGDKKRKDRKTLEPIRLNTHESTRAFHVPEHQVVGLIERLFRRWAGVIDEDARSELAQSPHAAINMSLHVVSKRDIIEQFVQLSFEKSLWTGRLRTLDRRGWDAVENEGVGDSDASMSDLA